MELAPTEVRLEFVMVIGYIKNENSPRSITYEVMGINGRTIMIPLNSDLSFGNVVILESKKDGKRSFSRICTSEESEAFKAVARAVR